MPEPCVVSFDHVYTVRRSAFRQRITRLPPERMHDACGAIARALGCV